MQVRRIVFWMNMVSPHMAPWIREVRALGLADDVELVALARTLAERAELGWTCPDLGDVQVQVRPSEDRIRLLLERDVEDSIHVLGGLRACTYSARLLRVKRRLPLRCGVVSEGYNVHGWKGLVRRVTFRRITLKYGRTVDFLLAMGASGCRAFKDVGWPEARLFPFAYATEQSSPHSFLATSDGGAGPVRLVYMGQLIRRKGIHVLLQALAGVPTRLKWNFTIYGIGPEERTLRRTACRLGLSGMVTFQGRVAMEVAICKMRAADLLVLPSAFDGWGAVINEALGCGTRVLCSRECGASDLIRGPSRGEVIAHGAIDLWQEALTRWIQRGQATIGDRDAIRKWSVAISGINVARYFGAVLDHAYGTGPRPIPAWLVD